MALIRSVVDSLARLSESLTFAIELAECVLLFLKVGFNLSNRLLLRVALSCVHLLLAEGNDALLVSVLVLDSGLELSDEFFDCTFRVLPDFKVLAEARNFLVVIKGFAAF